MSGAPPGPEDTAVTKQSKFLPWVYFAEALGGKTSDCVHFTLEEIEAQRG